MGKMGKRKKPHHRVLRKEESEKILNLRVYEFNQIK